MTHTATPWHSKQLMGVQERGFALFSRKQQGTARTTHRIDLNGEYSKDDAEFIEVAVNAHDDLVAALANMVDWYAKRDEVADIYREAHQPAEIRQAMQALAKVAA